MGVVHNEVYDISRRRARRIAGYCDRLIPLLEDVSALSAYGSVSGVRTHNRRCWKWAVSGNVFLQLALNMVLGIEMYDPIPSVQ